MNYQKKFKIRQWIIFPIVIVGFTIFAVEWFIRYGLGMEDIDSTDYKVSKVIQWLDDRIMDIIEKF